MVATVLLSMITHCKLMQDKQSYNFVESLRDHLESHSQGDVIVTHCNAGQKYVITINQSCHKICLYL